MLVISNLSPGSLVDTATAESEGGGKSDYKRGKGHRNNNGVELDWLLQCCFVFLDPAGDRDESSLACDHPALFQNMLNSG